MTSKSPKSTETKKQNQPQTRSAPNSPAVARRGSKAAAVIALLKRNGGATLGEMMSETGWQEHSVRGFIAGALKKRYGLVVTSSKTQQDRSYSVASEAR